MDFKLEKKKLNLAESFAEISAQQNTEIEINLPDYCSDIKRILKCILVPGISSVSLSGENVTALGIIDVRLIYVNEKDKIDCYETQKDLSVTASVKNIPADPVVRAYGKTNYVNCRATSQRRISVEGNIGVNFTVLSESKRDIPVNAEGCGVQCKKEKTAYQELICQKEKVFDLGETIQVPSDKSAVGKILRAGAWAVLDSEKAVSDKLLIKGEMFAEILYCSEEEEGKIEKIKHSMPISQIIDLPGVDENSSCSVELKVRQLTLSRKADSSSGGRLLEIGAKVCAMVRCTVEKEIDVIDDCYSVSHDIKSDYAIQEFTLPVYSISNQKTVKKTVDMPSADISSVIDAWCSDISSSVKGKGDKVKGTCTATVCILYLDGKNSPNYAEKNVDFDVDIKLKKEYEFLKCSLAAQARSIDCTVSGKEKTDIKMETGIIAEVHSAESKRILKDLQIVAENKQQGDTPALTLYFPNEGEKIWDIARKYNTTTDAIKNENTLETDIIEKEGMILIPCV